MKINNNISLAPLTTLKVGGPARFFCEAKNEEEIVEALKFAQEKNLPIFILGGGSNILVSDKGFEGVVIRINDLRFKIYDLRIECGAGCLLNKAVSESVKAELTGLEWSVGVPGTVAGAVRGNAGCFGGEMSEIVEKVEAIDLASMSKKKFNNKECEFDYRDSIFKRNGNLLITEVVFKLSKGNSEKSRKKIAEIPKIRKETQPIGLKCSGSFFKNPIIKNEKLFKEYETDTGNKITGNAIPAGYLIDRAGLKGKKIGGAMVSEKHANFIVNTGNATAENVVMLAAIIKTRVRNKFGIQLKEEVEMVGF